MTIPEYDRIVPNRELASHDSELKGDRQKAFIALREKAPHAAISYPVLDEESGIYLATLTYTRGKKAIEDTRRFIVSVNEDVVETLHNGYDLAQRPAFEIIDGERVVTCDFPLKGNKREPLGAKVLHFPTLEEVAESARTVQSAADLYAVK